MFKNLYNNIINLNINFKTNNNLNFFTFLKKSSLLKNYSNYLNYYITLNNFLKLKTIQSNFWKFSPDKLLTPINILFVVWLIIDFLIY